MLYAKYPLSLRNVDDLLAERGIDISHETVRYWWNRFGGDIHRASSCSVLGREKGLSEQSGHCHDAG